MISLIAAIDRNNVIGTGGKLPWHLPGDFAWFKSVTMDKAVVMGRKTFDSIGRPLPRRLNIVISRTSQNDTDQVKWVSSLQDAMATAQREKQNQEIMIIGGGEIYRQALPLADRLYLTEVDLIVADADAFFPDFNKNAWQGKILATHDAKDGQPAFRIVRYDRLDT